MAETAPDLTPFFALAVHLGAARASATAYVAPAVAVLLGVALRDEPAGAALVGGAAAR